MRALLVRVVILVALLGAYGALQPDEVEGQFWGACWYCSSAGGWAWCETTSNEGWDYCHAETQDPNDSMRSYCVLGWYCQWLAA